MATDTSLLAPAIIIAAWWSERHSANSGTEEPPVSSGRLPPTAAL
jgi:hypothetical protein